MLSIPLFIFLLISMSSLVKFCVSLTKVIFTWNQRTSILIWIHLTACVSSITLVYGILPPTSCRYELHALCIWNTWFKRQVKIVVCTVYKIWTQVIPLPPSHTWRKVFTSTDIIDNSSLSWTTKLMFNRKVWQLH